jgi:NAD(P)-dependent dehydrogenase (short-subunit alcohol dehydrogenase family)
VIAVVTGAGRGIGRAIALDLAQRGLDVALLAQTEAQLEEAAGQVRERKRKALAVACDVARGEDVTRAAERILSELGPPDVVVANAGVVARALVTEMSEADWDRVSDVNLKGTFLTAKAFIPSMTARKRGRFVAMGSIASTLGTPKQSAYCATKWGVVGFVKSLAEELRGTGVQAMVVLPGGVDTEMLRSSGFPALMEPDHVAKVVTFAALDAPDAMNGSAIEMFGP